MYPVGLKIHKNLFTEKELENIETIINYNYNWEFEGKKKHHHYPEYVFKNNIKNIISGDCQRKIKTKDICDKCNCHMTINLKNNLPIPLWINNLIITKLIDNNIIKNNWCNCITIIMYKETVLNPHFDSPHIFELPIITLRLFNNSIISFDSKNEFGIDDIIQQRGDLTIMDGECITKYDHSIKKLNDNKTVSLVIRKIHPELINI